MRVHTAAWKTLVICLALFFVGACAQGTYEPQKVVSEEIITQGPDGTEVNEVDVFGFKRTERGMLVNPSPSESLEINLYDPQSFWDGAFDRNWMEYGNW